MKKDWTDPLYVIKRLLDYFDGKDGAEDWPETRQEIEQMIREERANDERLRWSMGDL